MYYVGGGIGVVTIALVSEAVVVFVVFIVVDGSAYVVGEEAGM
jgi:hypothetical protein